MAAGGSTAAVLGAYIAFEDEAGFSMTPRTARTWARRGHTPVIRVRGRTTRSLSVAALACYKAGERPRLSYRLHHYNGSKDARKSFARADCRDLLIAAHRQLGAPIVLVWDNCETHGARSRARGLTRGTTGPGCLAEDLSALRSRAVLAAAGPAGVSR